VLHRDDPARMLNDSRCWPALDSDGKTLRGSRTLGLDPVTVRVLRGHLDMVASGRAEHGWAYQDHGRSSAGSTAARSAPTPSRASSIGSSAGPDCPQSESAMCATPRPARRKCAGVNPKTVSARLGLASVAFTLQAYADPVSDLDCGEAERIARLLLTAVLDLPGR
jgi:hypothetical protein